MICGKHGAMMRDVAPISQGDISPSLFFVGEGIFPRMTDPVRDRIAERLKQTGKTPRAASLDSGMGSTAIRDIFRRPENSLTLETLKKLAVGLETSPEWLIFGAEDLGSFGGNAPTLRQTSSPTHGAELITEKMTPVPIVGDVEAGAFREAPEFDIDDMEYVGDYPDREFPHARRIGFRVRGDSMNDLRPRSILEGDKVIGLDFHDIEGQVVLRDGMIVVVEQTRDGGHTREWSVKQLEVYEDRYEFCPRSTSKKHKPIIVPNTVFHDPSEDDGRRVRILALVRRIIGDVAY
jgi:SOS-response transcriptional repressor LexA